MTDSGRVAVAVVALGDTDRLRRCLNSLVEHVTREPFRILAVINPAERDDPDPSPAYPQQVTVIRPESNLGWAGGLHAARAALPAGIEYFVWAQDDMVVAEGWLDALIATADRHPGVGAVGSVETDAEGRPNGDTGGFAVPAERVGLWNQGDVLRGGDAIDSFAETPLDWITSKGLLTRVSAWDDVGGTDPRLFPLNHVDKDYSVHLRAHGWKLLVAPAAHLFHARHQSAPTPFRVFLAVWQEPDFDRRWGPIASRLANGRADRVPHECASWNGLADVEYLVGREASRMIAPAARHAAQESERAHALARELADHRRTISWRITRPLRALRAIGRGRDAAPHD